MSHPAKHSGSPIPTTKPATRSSTLRQSLNLASVGKAIIAGVRSKDSSSDETKVSKKTRESSRRLSSATPQAPRASLSGDRPKRESTPETKTITRRRVSGQHSRSSTDEMRSPESNVTPQGSAPARASSLRPKTTATSGTALPKLRPRSVLIEPVKPPSPNVSRARARRRHSTSSDEGGKEQRKPQPSPSAAEKGARPISPLPHRAALKSSSAVNSTPPPTPSKLKPPSPTVYRNASPTRPTKVMKTATTTSAKSLPRPPSSASSSSVPPHTPKSSALKAVLTRSAQDRTKTGTTPIRNSPITPARDSPSPLARRALQNQSQSSKSAASSTFSLQTGNMSHISEANSEDSDEEDVELLLAPIAHLTAATPAMPRIQRTRKRTAPETPSRERSSTIKANPSLLLPPSSKSSLRPPKPSSNNEVNNPLRMSILSWEHASLSASRQLGPGEADKMLYDIAAPFSGPTSPAASSFLEVPPSPCLSAIDSPSLGFGSISQVLLPDVTPSPAYHLNSSRFSVSPEAAGDASSTYLRLQLAAAEELSNERMYRMMAMEEEIHNLKQAHIQQVEELATQMAFMEKENEQASYVAALEEKVRATRVSGEQAVREAVVRVEENARVIQKSALRTQRRKLDAIYASVLAGTAWNTVQDSCKSELDTLQGERQVLSLLLVELEELAFTL